jgi:O-6-methylguanine DNA methyltransferase
MHAPRQQRFAPEVLFWSSMKSSVGVLNLAAGTRGLRLIEFEGREFPPRNINAEWKQSASELQDVIAQLEQYFARERREFSFSLDLRGTPFQLRCWNELLRIPYGQTCSYGELARAVECTKGFRAVGQANHRNPIPIVVPCHRVLAFDGTLGGYGGGLAMKKSLLALEGAAFREH